MQSLDLHAKPYVCNDGGIVIQAACNPFLNVCPFLNFTVALQYDQMFLLGSSLFSPLFTAAGVRDILFEFYPSADFHLLLSLFGSFPQRSLYNSVLDKRIQVVIVITDISVWIDREVLLVGEELSHLQK